MKSYLSVITMCWALCGAAWGQSAVSEPQRPMAFGVVVAAQQQGNAASATKDNSAITGDQITKPAGAKGSTLIGCLTGPDQAGKYTLSSMTHRAGVQVLGSDDLKKGAGAKVKLTGKWEEGSASLGTASAEERRFQATEIEVLAAKCSVPSEMTPESKNKRKPTTVYNAPSDSSK